MRIKFVIHLKYNTNIYLVLLFSNPHYTWISRCPTYHTFHTHFCNHNTNYTIKQINFICEMVINDTSISTIQHHETFFLIFGVLS